jgi:hypothetical protein
MIFFSENKTYLWGLAINNKCMCFFLSGKVRERGNVNGTCDFLLLRIKGQLRRSFIAYTKWGKTWPRWDPLRLLFAEEIFFL